MVTIVVVVVIIIIAVNNFCLLLLLLLLLLLFLYNYKDFFDTVAFTIDVVDIKLDNLLRTVWYFVLLY